MTCLQNPKRNRRFDEVNLWASTRYKKNQNSFLDDFFRIIYAFCRMSKIERQAQSEIHDPKDLYLLSFAESIEADYIVSGDTDLLELGQHKTTKMLRLADFKMLLLDN